MTTSATTDLAEVLALLDGATPGEWQVFAPDDYEEGGCSLSKLGVESATDTAVVWYADLPQQGIENDPDAEAIASSVNYLRTHGDTLQRALVLLEAVDSGEWKCVPTRPSIDMLSAGSEALSDAGVDNVGPEDSPMCYAAMLAAAPPPLIESVSQWRPIETAPKDTAVLVTFADGDIPNGQMTMPGVMVAYWDAYSAPGGNGYDGVGDGWTDAHSGEGCHLHYGHPTHWMPLPAAPAAPGVGG